MRKKILAPTLPYSTGMREKGLPFRKRDWGKLTQRHQLFTSPSSFFLFPPLKMHRIKKRKKKDVSTQNSTTGWSPLLQYVHTFTVRYNGQYYMSIFWTHCEAKNGSRRCTVRMRRSVDFLHSPLCLFVPLLLHVRYDKRQRRRTP